ncbi:MAG: pyridoxamine 5'-phosphate oxidase family protein [Lentilitoribacter sp.]
MDYINSIDELEALYGTPGEASIIKVVNKITPGYRKWIEQSKFCIISTVGPEGTDASPRGDENAVALELDEQTLAIPDWRGNNRMDSLRNIIRDERVSLMFFVHGSNNVIRLNGKAKITTDEDLSAKFERKTSNSSVRPRSIIIIKVEEIYSQCARALMRSRIWQEDPNLANLPTIGDLLKDATEGEFDGMTYDKEWSARAAKTMW